MSLAAKLEIAKAAIRDADAVLIGAGAGMGVDSGLPDFRGKDGFWRAYPVFRELGLSFAEAANPVWFEKDPSRAWGFYGHRFNLYRNARPHLGFELLRRLIQSKGDGGFVFTSNVDGHFGRAGFPPDKIVECHGSILRWQCLESCGQPVWDCPDLDLEIDEEQCRALGDLPACPACRGLARPSILMFGDWGWDGVHTDRQEARFREWQGALHEAARKLVIIEIGAGTAVPTVRHLCESTAYRFTAPFIRINPRDLHGRAGAIPIPLGGLEGLRQLGLER